MYKQKLKKMFCRKQTIPPQFEADNFPLLENDNDGLKHLRHKIFSVTEETEAIKQQNGSLSIQRARLINELENSTDMQETYERLKAERKAATDLKNNLEKQVSDLLIQLERHKALEVKCKSAKEEIKNLMRNIHIHHQEIVLINNKLVDHKALKDEYQSVKAENKTLNKQNIVLQNRGQDLLLKIFWQDHPEDKYKTAKEENQVLSQLNMDLQRMVQELTQKHNDGQMMKAQYETMKAEKSAMMDHNFNLQRRIKALTQQYEDVKPSVNKYYDIKAEMDAICRQNTTLMQQLNDLQSNIKHAQTSCHEDSVLPNQIQELRKDLQNFESVELRRNEEKAGSSQTNREQSMQLPNWKVGDENNKNKEDKKEGVCLVFLQRHFEGSKEGLGTPIIPSSRPERLQD